MARRDASQTVNGLGEVIPRDDTLVREVIRAWHHSLIDSGEDGCGQVARIGWRSEERRVGKEC